MENFNIFNKVEEIKKEYALGDSEEICYLLNGKKYDEEYLPTLYSIDIVGGKLIVNYDDEDYSDMEINEAGRLIAKYVDKETQKIVTRDLGQVVPNFSVGSTTTGEAGTDANVTMTGSITEPVLNFTIPKGEDFDGNITNDLTIKKDSPSIILENSDSTNTIKITGTSTGFNISTADSNVYEYNGDHIFSKNIYINKTKPEFILQNELNSFSLLWDKLDDASSVLYFKDFTNSENLASIQQSSHQFNAYGVIQSLTDIENGYGTIYAGTKINMISNEQGGNLKLWSQNGENSWEFDSYNNNDLRLYCGIGGTSSSTINFTADGNIYLNSKQISIQDLNQKASYTRGLINDSLRKTDMLEVDTENYLTSNTNWSQIISTNDASTLQNSPVSQGAFVGTWSVNFQTPQQFMVEILEYYPNPGRHWYRKYTAGSWGAWYVIT